MKISKALHIISHLRWLFLLWIIGLILYIFFFHPANPVQLTGKVIFLAGIMMGLTSLSDVTTITDKQKSDLLNPRTVRIIYRSLFSGAVILVVISLYFFAQRFILPNADSKFISDFTGLGFDCLVMMLGFLTLIKQLSDQVDYAKGLPES